MYFFKKFAFVFSCSLNSLSLMQLYLQFKNGGTEDYQVEGACAVLETYISANITAVFNSVQSLSHVQLFVTPWTAAHQASLSITNSQSLLKLMSIESVMPSNHLILCHPLFLPPSIFPSNRVFSNVSSSCQVAKYWSFSFSISPSNEYSGLISFRIDWLDLLAVQGTLKSCLQHQVQNHQFFSAQLSL